MASKWSMIISGVVLLAAVSLLSAEEATATSEKELFLQPKRIPGPFGGQGRPPTMSERRLLHWALSLSEKQKAEFLEKGQISPDRQSTTAVIVAQADTTTDGGASSRRGQATSAPVGHPAPMSPYAPGVPGMFKPRKMIPAADPVQQQLEKKITIQYPAWPLTDVITDLRERSGLNIHVHWASLENAGIDRQQEVTIDLHNVTVEKVLQTILADLSSAVHSDYDYERVISYVVDQGVVTIAKKEDLTLIAHAEGKLPAQKAEQIEIKLDLVDRLQKVCFDPAASGLIASAGLRDDVRRSRGEIIEDLESLLAKTTTLGLRNAIRLALRDLYKATGNTDKVLEHLRVMLAENDEASSGEKVETILRTDRNKDRDIR